ncbi:MAG: nicotinate (nicotinamide) nucleotide adenylyltransferase [Sphaerochaetaceae bacterium]|nr:nicotinate (nicotinamide) nucleotide adenylyltransferase [Sphaerochaetaceae bacterium]
MKNKIAIVGGSFDPVHLGHLFLINSVFEKTEYNKIFLVPVYINNFKRQGAFINSEDRLEMLRLAKKDFYDLYPQHSDKQIIIDDREIKREGVSYTYDSVMEIKKEENLKGLVGLIMGDDLVPGLNRWYKIDELKKEVEFVIFNRNDNKERIEVPPGFNYRLIDNEIYKSSSTQVREDGNKKLLSRRVAEYVRKKALYD